MLTESDQIHHNPPLVTRNEESEDSFELQRLVRKLSAAVVAVQREPVFVKVLLSLVNQSYQHQKANFERYY